MTNLVYPAPMKRCKDKVTGKMLEFYLHWKDGSITTEADDIFFAMKVNEELGEVLAEKNSFCLQGDPDGEFADYEERAAREIVDIITVCHSWLHTVYDMDDEYISKLIEEANEKNRARGYLDD